MAGEIRVPVWVAVKDGATEKLEGQLNKLSKSFGTFGSITGKAIGAITSFGAAIGAAKFFSDSIDQAKNLERSLLSVSTVFGAMGTDIRAFAKAGAEYGLSQSEAAKASVFLGSVLKQSGFSMEETTKRTQELVKLGVDLAATYGYDVQEALMGMTALFRGEYDPIEKFGVAMKQSEINSELAARGQDKLTGAARRFAEQQVRIELLLLRSADAQGAFARGQGTLYVETEKLRVAFENMQADLGAKLTPALVLVMTELQDLIPVIGQQLAEAIGKVDWEGLVTFIGDFVSYIANNFDKIINFATAITSLAIAFTALKVAIDVANVAMAIFAASPVVRAALIALGAFSLLAPAVLEYGKSVQNSMTEQEKFRESARSMVGRQKAIEEGFKKGKKAADDFNSSLNKTNNLLNSRVPAAFGFPGQMGPRYVAPDSGVDGGAGTTESQFKKVQKIIKDYQSKLTKLERDYTRQKFQINRDYLDDIDKLNKDALKRQDDLLEQSRNRLRSAFESATKLSLGEIVQATSRVETTIKQLTSRLSVSVSKEVKSISETAASDLLAGLTKQLEASRQLARAAEGLANKGFSQTFIEQILATGTETGNQLASAILNASPEMQAGLKEAFIGLETVSETGLDSLVTQFGLATRELNKESEKIANDLKDALAEKQRQLATALADAAYLFGVAIGDLKDDFTAAIGELDGKLAGLGKTIDELLAKMARLQSGALTDVQAALTGKGGPLEGAVITRDIKVAKDAITASGIVIDSVNDLAGTSAYIAERIAAAEKYIKSAASNAAQDASAKESIKSWTRELAAAQQGITGTTPAGNIININVKTDSTQSVAMVGRTLGKYLTTYTQTGGTVRVSGNN